MNKNKAEESQKLNLINMPENGQIRRRTIYVVLFLLIAISIFFIYSNYVKPIVRVKGFFVSNKDCLQCHVKMLSLLEKEDVHDPFAEKKCTICHTPHENSKGLKLGKTRLVKPKGKLCLSCHEKDVKKYREVAYKHKPFEKEWCSSCHNAHASDYSSLLRRQPSELCLACHRMVDEFRKEVIHPPFKKRNCTNCHSPHGSATKYILKQPQKTLCLSCHEKVGKLTKMPVLHSPFDKGECTKCHFPHSASRNKLLVDSSPKLCYGCHKDKPAEFAKISHHPVPDKINCTGCHNPHGTMYSKLAIAEILDNSLCFTCHKDKPLYYGKIPHSKATGVRGKGMCLNCHIVHGSDFVSLTRKEQIELCRDCHKPPTKYQHPVGESYKDLWHGGTMKCTSCHNPHGTQFAYMWLRDKGSLCLSCHTNKMMINQSIGSH
jgi:predicted CXXCH cytochrome family protein